MWCPKCKTEYQDGIVECADCKVPLVESLAGENTIDVCIISQENVAEEIVKFLEYSNIPGASVMPAENEDGYRVVVDKKDAEKAQKIVRGYILGKQEEKAEAAPKNETVQTEQEDFSEDVEASEAEPASETEKEDSKEDAMFSSKEEDISMTLYDNDKKEYVLVADKYKDIKFSGYTFIGFGILGWIYLILTRLNVIPISYSDFVFAVIAVLFVGFLIGGAVSIAKALRFKKMIPTEQEEIDTINRWLQENITDELIESWNDGDATQMENDLLLAAKISKKAKDAFPDITPGLVEVVADKYYEENFQ